MKNYIFLVVLCLIGFSYNGSAQVSRSYEHYGSTLNLAVGVGGYAGYYRYVGRSLPVFHLNYEFDVAKNFTLAPFVSFSTYSNERYWGDNGKNHPYGYYRYTETTVPIGIKGSYYFDKILNAGSKWDFYLAGSLGFAIVRTSWDNTYYGDRNYYGHGNPIFLDLHIGTEYHFNKRLGGFIDISTGTSLIGISIH